MRTRGARWVIRYFPVEDGTVVSPGSIGFPGISGEHKLLGYQSGRVGAPTGWMVVMVNEAVTGNQPRVLSQPSAASRKRLRLAS